MESEARGGTRWKRFAVVMVPSVMVTAGIGLAMGQGALAASFSVSGQQFQVTAERLSADGFIQYGSYDEQAGGKNVPVGVLGFKEAKITGMCQSVVTPNIPLVGTITFKLSGGDSEPVEASNLYIDMVKSDADAVFTNLNIGVAAGSSEKGPGLKKGDNASPGSFAQEADHVEFTGAKQTAWATTAGTFKMNGLKMRLHKGEKGCF